MTDIKDELLKVVLNSMTITPTGSIEWHGIEHTKYKRNLSLLLSELMNTNFQSKLNHVRYYFTPEHEVFFGHELNNVLKKLKEEGKTSFNEFLEELNIMLDTAKQQNSILKFEIYFPINVSIKNKLANIKFRDIEIQLLSYEDIKEIFNTDKLKEDFDDRYRDFKKSNYNYIKVIIRGRNKEYAHQTALKYTTLILGFMAFLINYGGTTTSIMGPPHRLLDLKTSFAFVFKEEDAKIEYVGYYYDPEFNKDTKHYEFVKKQGDDLNNLINSFNSSKENIQEIISRAINSYYLGLFDNQINYSFLNFWTALEVICLKTRRLREIEVINRIKFLLVGLTEIDKYAIDRCYSLRNNLIHSADYKKITQYDRNLLKIYFDVIFGFFMTHLIKFNIQEINSIYSFIQKNVEELKTNKKIIDYVIKLKEEEKSD